MQARLSLCTQPMLRIIIDPSLPKSLTDTRDNIFGFDNAQVESQIQVLRSESIAQAVVKKLKLTEDPAFSGVSSSILTYPFRLLNGAPDRMLLLVNAWPWHATRMAWKCGMSALLLYRRILQRAAPRTSPPR